MNQAASQPGWFGRNWKWFVPMGCMGLIAIFFAFIMIIVTVVFGAIKSSDAYKGAIAQAKNHPAVVAALGQPIEEGRYAMGNINVSGNSGQANLDIPISGPKGSGMLHVEATKFGGQWQFKQLAFKPDVSGPMLNLLQ